MSFFSSNRTSRTPGPLTGNPLNGLCEKACLEVKKVFDACQKQAQEVNTPVTVTNFTPADPAQPLTYVSARAIAGTTTISNLVVDRFDDKPCFARITGDVSVPFVIYYTDANGVEGSATADISVNVDVVMYVPQPSVFPFSIEALTSAAIPNGEYIGNNTFSMDMCITIILKVVVEAEILVPTYGYCAIPACQDYTQDVCSGFFDLPLYPQTNPVTPLNN